MQQFKEIVNKNRNALKKYIEEQENKENVSIEDYLDGMDRLLNLTDEEAITIIENYDTGEYPFEYPFTQYSCFKPRVYPNLYFKWEDYCWDDLKRKYVTKTYFYEDLRSIEEILYQNSCIKLDRGFCTMP